MENYDQRRRQSNDERRYSGSGYEDRGEQGSSWRERPHDDRPRRAERGWLDYDRDYGRSEERQGSREGQRYGQGGEERASFSPDWSREGERPRYSDDPYYARNRDRGGSEEYSRSGRSGWEREDDRNRWGQRARNAMPREQYDLAERSERGDYYDPDWPYQRSSRSRDTERSRDDEQQSHYRGYYSRSSAPFAYPGGSGYMFAESLTLHGPYSGRGPKGYKRSDQQIIEEACQRLERDGEIDASDIEVTAEDGVIRLRGTVQDRKAKRRAEECVESVYGARDVMNELRVSQQGGEQSQGTQGAQNWQSSQSSQSGRGSQPSQASQGGLGSQTSQGSQASEGSPTSTPGMRSGGASSEQPGEDKRSPRH